MTPDILQRPLGRKPWPDIEYDDDLMAWSAIGRGEQIRSDGEPPAPSPLPMLWSPSATVTIVRELSRVIKETAPEPSHPRMPSPIKTYSPFHQGSRR